MRMKVDCTLAELGDRKDGDWVSVGGIVTQTKRLRTKRGDHMMFATLDDLEGTVEMLIFGRVLAASEEAFQLDSVITVRGRVDQKDQAKTVLIVQDADKFEPTEAEIEKAREAAARIVVGPPPVRLRLDATALPATVIEDLKAVFESFPGESVVVLEMQTSSGPRKLRLGAGYKVARNAAFQAELDHLLGSAMLEPAAA
jgi:DNA polymerase-3 subunit alpha